MKKLAEHSFNNNIWKYNKKFNTIYYKIHDHYEYEIDLCRIDEISEDKRAYEILDWIFHINGKIWATEKVHKDLISMFKFMYHIFPTGKITIKKEWRN